jgi:hypothetical protein
LTRWREALSRLFDNHEYRGRVGELSRIRVAYGGVVPPVEAWYMAAWLEGALRTAGREPELALEPDPTAPAGELASVELSGRSPADLSVVMQARGAGLTVRAGGLASCTPIPRPPEYRLLSEELGIVRRDPVFEISLCNAASLAVSS